MRLNIEGLRPLQYDMDCLSASLLMNLNVVSIRSLGPVLVDVGQDWYKIEGTNLVDSLMIWTWKLHNPSVHHTVQHAQHPGGPAENLSRGYGNADVQGTCKSQMSLLEAWDRPYPVAVLCSEGWHSGSRLTVGSANGRGRDRSTGPPQLLLRGAGLWIIAGTLRVSPPCHKSTGRTSSGIQHSPAHSSTQPSQQLPGSPIHIHNPPHPTSTRISPRPPFHTNWNITTVPSRSEGTDSLKPNIITRHQELLPLCLDVGSCLRPSVLFP